MLTQRLQQKLQQKLSPQQIQLMKLLQVPTIALEQRIKQELEENPALEDGSENEEDQIQEDDYDDGKDEETETSDDEFDLSDYVDDDEIPDYKYNANNTSKDDEEKIIPYASGSSFQEIITTQFHFKDITEREEAIGDFIIGNLDDSGYLNRELEAMVDDFAFTQNIMTTVEEIEAVLQIIQSLEPPGIGARNLQECLENQLKLKDTDKREIAVALKIIQRYFLEFSKKHYSKIIQRANISEEELKLAIDEILKLNPKPGNSLIDSIKVNQFITPDFLIENDDGELVLTLNGRNMPELHVSRSYKDLFETYNISTKKDQKQKDTVMFIKQKLDSAKWFIDAIRQRHQTLLLTMEAIMAHQYEYFTTGDETNLKPMILKDIAEKVNLDISTISRVVNSKYVQTPFGTFLLKSFFSESMQNTDGEEVSTREIKKILMDVIEAENKKKPIIDEKLVIILKEKGYNIARRTIAKYREQLGIPVARMRKQL
ncbi:MAG: RNA polymerase sigma-54 factor [Bacteroidetes bacterium CG2_30_33_31]|nr:MAG: RNA polymerase sigma-54 factor [Bacteroidetes bacterium CG2_30_33_31]